MKAKKRQQICKIRNMEIKTLILRRSWIGVLVVKRNSTIESQQMRQDKAMINSLENRINK